MPNIIMLLGVSSSGKTTIAKEIQRQANDQYTIVGFDIAVEFLDKKYWPGGSHETEGFYYKKIKTERGEFPELAYGMVGANFLKNMLNDIISLMHKGQNLIIDFVMSNEQRFALISACANAKVLQVGIKPPLDEIIRREKARDDRKEGIAEALYEDFYKEKIFD